MRIVLSAETFLPKIDGISKMACLTLDYFQRWGYEALVLAPSQGVTEYGSYRVIGLPCITNPKYPEGKISFPTINTYRAIRDFKPDIIHAIDPGPIGMGLIFSAKYLSIPTVASYHLSFSESFRTYGLGLLAPVVGSLRKWTFNYVDHALAVSKNAQRIMHQEGVRRVGIWRRGVDSEKFHPRYRSHEMRCLLSDNHPDDTLLLYVGRLAPDKQVVQIKTILENVPNTRLALVGGGPQEEELKEIFKGLPVVFAGYKKGVELASAYASADMFVFASLHESFGLVLAEALASGIPVVSSRVGGADDIIQHGESGYVFDVNDTDSLFNYVQELVQNPAKRVAMGQKARQFAEQLSWDGMMDELKYFYEDVLYEKDRLPKPNRPHSPMFQNDIR